MVDGHVGCPGDEALVALALGELTGRARADALAHVTACCWCREHVDALIATADRLLLAAPDAEPPVGFEAAVLDRTAQASRAATSTDGASPSSPGGSSPGGSSPARWRRSGVLAVAASVVAVVAIAAAVLLFVARTEQVAEAAMVTPGGREVGSAWIHDVDPTWVLVSVPGWEVWETVDDPPEEYLLEIELDDGDVVTLDRVDLDGDDGSWGATIGLDPARIRSLSIIDDTGRTWCSARF
ncbi:MAG: hypothetical protein WD225_07435 [Ilumatobacteraceae bacterium]